MKRFALLAAAGAGALALGAAVLLSDRAPRTTGSTATADVKTTPPVPAPVAATPEPAAQRGDPSRAATPAAVPRLEAAEHPLPPAWPGSELSADEYELSKIDIFFALQAETAGWTVERYAQFAARRDQLSGREAYQVYTYLRSCLDRPRSAAELDTRLEHLRGERMRQRVGADGVEEAAERVRRSFVRCENLPSDRELPLLMLEWLTLAANRGFPQAQLAYYQSARWLLTIDRWNPYRQPQRVYEYRRLAPLFLQAAVEAGHPDAFAEYALALQDGILFETDLQAAYGYAVAADLAHHGRHDEARNMMLLFELELSPDQVRDARQMGRELCRRHCLTP